MRWNSSGQFVSILCCTFLLAMGGRVSAETIAPVADGQATLSQTEQQISGKPGQAPDPRSRLPTEHPVRERCVKATRKFKKAAFKVTRITLVAAMAAAYVGGTALEAYGSSQLDTSSHTSFPPVGSGFNRTPRSSANLFASSSDSSYSANTLGGTTFINGSDGITTAQRIGNMTFINGPAGMATAQQIGNMTFINGPNGTTTANTIGNTTFINGPSGTATANTIGNTTFVNGPGTSSGTIQTIGNSSFANFSR